jgi:POT family proton-dependent oligopeptide transporter
VLFITEMWERFSYYGMRALLVFYLVSKTTGENSGFGWSDEDAQTLYGWYTGLVYLTPILGGWLADKFLGTHRSMLVGGWIIAAGHFCLAFTELFGHGAVSTVTFASAPAPFLIFMTGLVLIIIGTGFFKPCVSVMVGQLYSDDDPRRDSGFTIFYMGINVGAFLSGVVAGTLGEIVGWHWGFGSAGVGMVLGLTVYQMFRPMFLKGIGLPPHHEPEHDREREPTPEQIRQAEIDERERTRPMTRIDWDRMIVVMTLGIFAIVFWIAFEQAGSSLNLFALRRTDREMAGFEFPATWYQSVNPAAIVLFAPVFAWLWVWLDKRKKQPSTPVKFAIGLMLLSVGYVVMIFGALDAGRRIVTPEEAPAAARSVILQQAGDCEIDRLEEISLDEESYYDAEWMEDEKPVRVLIGADGQLFRKVTEEVENSNDEETSGSGENDRHATSASIDQVPEAVRAAILQQAGENRLETIEEVTSGNTATYDVCLQENGNDVRMSIDAEGKLVNKSTAGYDKVGLAGPHWLLLLYTFMTWGELCLSPVGLSMVTRLSPARYTSVMMGLYFGTYFVANLTAGYVAAFSSRIEKGDVFTMVGGQADFFLLCALVPFVIGLIVLALSPKLNRMMHGLQ